MKFKSHRGGRRFLALVSAVLAGLVSTAVQAGSFTVSPVRIEIAMPRKAAAVEVENNGDRPAQIQVERFQWQRDNGADDELLPTEDYIVTPPIVSLQPGQRQILRVMFLKPLDPRREATYRLILQETPLNDPPPNTIATVLRLSLPVFVTPAGAKSELVWSQQWRDGKPALAAENRGTAHAFIVGVKTPEGGKLPPTGYILPGETRSWFLESVAPERLVVQLRDGTEASAAVSR